MSLRQGHSSLRRPLELSQPHPPARDRRRARRRRHLGLIVTRLEERALLTIPTITTLVDSAASLTYGQTEVFTATVTTDPHTSNTPTGGTVTFLDGTIALGTSPLTDGTAQLTVPALGVGSHEVTAVFSGTSLFGGSRTPVTPSPTITTVAGGGNPAVQPALYNALTPMSSLDGTAVDGSGDLFIADSGANVVREINHSTRVVSTIAGNGTAGYSGDAGPATAAELAGPDDLALDGSGDLYIADSNNNVVREVNLKTGIITTVGGTGTAGYSGDGGPATAASLSDPDGIALNGSGNLFIADTNNNAVREVNLKTGTITTVAGTGAQGDSGDGGPAISAEVNAPEGIAVDGSGNLFIADTGNNVVREVNLATGIITTVAGNGTGADQGDGGPAAAAELNSPEGVAVSASGELYIADSGNSAVRAVNLKTGIITTVAGNGNEGYWGDGGPATLAELASPVGLALDGSGDLFIADNASNTLREVNLGTGIITTAAGGDAQGYSGDGGPATVAELGFPNDVALDASGDLFIADTANNVVREVNGQTGDITTIAGNGTAGYLGDGGPAKAAELSDPTGVAVDSSGDLFIADCGNNVVREVNLKTGIITTIAGNGTDGYSGDGGPATAAELAGPTSVALGGSSDLFISDTGNSVVREVNLATGIITTVAGDAISGYSGDGGPATQAQLASPIGLAVDAAGDLFIADTVDDVIREVNAQTGDISTIAGNGNTGYSGDGEPATAAELSSPEGVAVDAAGHLYIADTLNDVIREVNLKSGTITTVAGTAGSTGYNGDGGPAAAAVLGPPAGIAVDSTGNLYISDTMDNVIREVSTPTNLGKTISVAKAPPVTPAPAASVTPVKVLAVTIAPAPVPGGSIHKTARSRHKASRVIVVQLSGAVRGSAAQSLSDYTLTTLPRGRKKAQPVALAEATYNSATLTVTLVTRKKLTTSVPLQLTINAAALGLPGSGDIVAALGK